MVPDKFNMVDMGGIDILYSQGIAIDGLYQRLVESIAQCRYQCLYNWLFDGILIPPTYVMMDIDENDLVTINEGISVDDEDVIHVYSLLPNPVISELSVTQNGTYTPPTGTDGYAPVIVDVPPVEPVISELSVTQNGTYTPPTGTDGYAPVIVDVPASAALSEEWAGSATGSINGIEALISSVSIVDDEFSFTATGYFNPRFFFDGNKIEIETGVLNISSGSHRRFITTSANADSGLIYRGTGYWSFYLSNGWIDTIITDPNYFDNSTVKVECSSTGLWSVYKNGVFVFDSGSRLLVPKGPFVVGSSAGSGFAGIIKKIKIY